MFYAENEQEDLQMFALPEGATLRPNDDGTVTLIMPSGGEHTYDPDQVFGDPQAIQDDVDRKQFEVELDLLVERARTGKIPGL